MVIDMTDSDFARAEELARRSAALLARIDATLASPRPAPDSEWLGPPPEMRQPAKASGVADDALMEGIAFALGKVRKEARDAVGEVVRQVDLLAARLRRLESEVLPEVLTGEADE